MGSEMHIRHLIYLFVLELICTQLASASPKLKQLVTNKPEPTGIHLQVKSRYDYTGWPSSLFIRKDGKLEARLISGAYNDRASKLHVLSPNFEKLTESNIDSRSELVGSIEDKHFIGIHGPDFYKLNLGEHSWQFSKAHNDSNLYKVGDSVYFASIRIDNRKRSVFLRKIMEGQVPVNGEDHYIAEDMHPNQLVSFEGELYFEAERMFFKLKFDDADHKTSQLLKGHYLRIAIGEMDGLSLLATVPSKVFIQNTLKIFTLPDKQVLHEFKLSYGIFNIYLSTGKNYALLGVSSKESVHKGELMLFDKQGSLLSHDKGFRLIRHIKYNPLSESFVLAVDGESPQTGEILEIKVIDDQNETL